MINKDRIVPVMRTDLLTLYGTAMKLAGIPFQILKSKDIPGNFENDPTDDEVTIHLCDQPVKKFTFYVPDVLSDDLSFYFVADFDFEGIEAVLPGGMVNRTVDTSDVINDAATLFCFTMTEGGPVISHISPIFDREYSDDGGSGGGGRGN